MEVSSIHPKQSYIAANIWLNFLKFTDHNNIYAITILYTIYITTTIAFTMKWEYEFRCAERKLTSKNDNWHMH